MGKPWGSLNFGRLLLTAGAFSFPVMFACIGMHVQMMGEFRDKLGGQRGGSTGTILTIFWAVVIVLFGLRNPEKWRQGGRGRPTKSWISGRSWAWSVFGGVMGALTVTFPLAMQIDPSRAAFAVACGAAGGAIGGSIGATMGGELFRRSYWRKNESFALLGWSASVTAIGLGLVALSEPIYHAVQGLLSRQAVSAVMVGALFGGVYTSILHGVNLVNADRLLGRRDEELADGQSGL